jgi:hypothetical protein
MKYAFIFCCVLIACKNNTQSTSTQTDTTKLQSVNNDAGIVSNNAKIVDTTELIVPGEGIGKVKLGEDVTLLNVLGSPDSSDAAMGKAWLTWMGKRDEHNNIPQLNVYTTYADNNMQEKTVQQIRTTSSRFFTADSVHVYSSLETIRQSFPLLQTVASYNEDGKAILIYDAIKKGIAFEIAKAGNQEICTGIIVHKKGQNVVQIYMMVHPDMKRKKL